MGRKRKAGDSSGGGGLPPASALKRAKETSP